MTFLDSNATAMLASQLLATINSTIQSWAQSLHGGGSHSLSEQLEDHLSQLDVLLPHQATRLRMALADEHPDPVRIVEIAAKLAQAADLLRQIDSGEGSSSRHTARSTRPPQAIRLLGSISSMPPPVNSDSSPVNLARMTGGLLATLDLMFEDYLERAELPDLASQDDIPAMNKQAAVFFTDFSGFSNATRNVPPENVRQRLNFYFAFLSLLVVQLGGKIDKYIGDAIMGYVIDHGNNSLRAVEIATTMQDLIHRMNEILRKRAVRSDLMKEKLQSLGKSWDDLGSAEQDALVKEVDPLIFQMRVGVNAGQVMYGNVGGPGRIELTVLGDVVNTANRMESLCKPGGVCVSESVRQDIDGHYLVDDGRDAEAKGIGVVKAYQVLGPNPHRTVRVEGRVSVPVVGRQPEIENLRAKFSDIMGRSQSGYSVIVGRGGMGKSTVADEFLKSLPEGSHDLILARGEDGRELAPYEVIAEALRARAKLNEKAKKEEREARIRALSTEAQTDSENQKRSFAHLLGLFLDDPLENPPDDIQYLLKNPSEFHQHVQAMLFALFAGLTSKRPLILLVDDLQWVDQASYQLVSQLLSGLKDKPFMVLGLSRTAEELWFGGRLGEELRELRPLSDDGQAIIAREILGGGVSDEVIRGIVEKADGNALFVQEIATSVKNGRSLDSVPGSVQAFFQSEFRGLLPHQMSTLKAAAIVGRQFTIDELLGVGIIEPEQALPVLIRKDFISVQNRSEGRFEFKHDLLRQAAAEMIEAAERRHIHRLYAKYLTAAKPDDYVLIASHFRNAGDLNKAAEFNLKAGDDLAKEGRGDAAINQYQKVLTTSQDPVVRLNAIFGWYDVLHYSKKYKEQLELNSQVEVLLSGLEPLENRQVSARAHLHMAHAHQYNGDAGRAEKLMQEGLGILGETVSPIRCRFLNGLGNIHSQQKKDMETAEAYYRAALSAAEAASDPYFMGMSLVNISHVNHVRGNYSEGLATALRAMECFEKAGDKNGYLHAVGNAGSSALSSGKLEHAVKLYERGVDVSKNQMSNRILSQLLPRLGRSYHLSDELKKAEEALDSAIAFVANEASTFMAGATRVYRSLLRLQLGDLSGALEDAELALRVADATKDRPDQLRAAAESARAQALLASGQYLEALAASTVAADLFAQLKHIQEFDTEILLTHAQILKFHGKNQEAEVWIERGRQLIEQRSASIPSDEERRIFRSGIKVNREILRSAQILKE